MQLLEVVDELNQSQNKLRLILDSVPQGIYGLDSNGICTFCNKSGLELLGYTKEDQLVGKNIHSIIHHSKKDGTPIPPEECKILSSFKKGKGIHVDDEVFWRYDGTFFDVEYFSYPEYINDKLTGVIVTFSDISSRKEAERKILFNSYHDTLTQLYNRRYLEEQMEIIDNESYLPISVIVGDVNGLKQMNDIFGHASGDMLIKQAAEIIKEYSTPKDICIRTGGDEFLVILPQTSLYKAENIARQIRKQFSQVHIQSFFGSISLGVATKTKADENLIHIIDIADSKMYRIKTIDRVKFNEYSIKAIFDKLHEMCPREKAHSERVRDLCYSLGKALGLSTSELRRLSDAAYYHDIGKIIVNSEVLNKNTFLSEQEMQLVRRHPVVGYRILNLSDKTLDIAKYVLSHHERWDGKGYPNHLKGKSIPKISRIIALADCYELLLHGANYRKATDKEDAIEEIKRNAGTQFDPEIVDCFIKLIGNYVD